MPVLKCPNGKWRIGTGPCVFTTRAAAERAYVAYLIQTHEERKAVQVLKSVGLAIAAYREVSKRREWGRYKQTTSKLEPQMARAVGKWMKQIRSAVLAKMPKTVDGVDSIPWEKLEAAGEKVVGPLQEKSYAAGDRRLVRTLRKARIDPIGVRAKQYARTTGSKMITEITRETREAVRKIVEDAIEAGLSPQQVERELRQVVGLTQAQAGKVSNQLTELLEAGMEEAKAFAAAERLASRALAYRAEMIARTEVNNALRTGIIETMSEAGVERVEWVADPEACEVCAGYNGNTYTIDEYEEIMNPHPNCECTVVMSSGEGL